MDILIITGVSGAGKTSAVNIAQDADYISVDNLPPKFINDYIELISKNRKYVEKLAFVIDIRTGEFISDLEEVVFDLKAKGHKVTVIYMDASDNELIKRFQEKRRPHYYKHLTLEDAIKTERENLINTRELSDYYIDTTGINLIALKAKLLNILEIHQEVVFKIVTFGFKYGILKEADFIFDARFIKNPFYIKDLRPKNGLDKEVRDYVFSFKQTDEFVTKIADLIEFISPSFVEQGKNNILIGIGCTGGQHRSVAIAERLNNILNKKFESKVFHREKKYWNKK